MISTKRSISTYIQLSADWPLWHLVSFSTPLKCVLYPAGYVISHRHNVLTRKIDTTLGEDA
jgi:hypothetical protein